MTIPRQTYVKSAYAAIREEILSGQLRPGAKVATRPLSERLGLSATPLKAALAVLEQEGFLTAVPHRGYFVSEVTTRDMREIYELREVIDGIAGRNAAGLGEHEEFAVRLRGLLAEQEAAADAGDLVAYSDIDLEFHRSIWQRAGNSRAVRVAENLLAQVRFGSGGSSRLPGRLPTALHEHAGIIDAIAAGDPVRAEAECRSHVRNSAEAFYRFTRARDEAGV